MVKIPYTSLMDLMHTRNFYLCLDSKLTLDYQSKHIYVMNGVHSYLLIYCSYVVQKFTCIQYLNIKLIKNMIELCLFV